MVVEFGECQWQLEVWLLTNSGLKCCSVAVMDFCLKSCCGHNSGILVDGLYARTNIKCAYTHSPQCRWLLRRQGRYRRLLLRLVRLDAISRISSYNWVRK